MSPHVTDTSRGRGWPIGVRPAAAADREAVLAFSTTTFDGWDYVPRAWESWLTDPTGVLLVATAGPGTGGDPVDAQGRPLAVGQPVGITHVAMLSPTEAWLEGIRVDPRARGMGVATDLQTAALSWAAALGATMVRYLTGRRNEASLRLGARHGLLPVGHWRFHGRGDVDDRGSARGRDIVGAWLRERAGEYLLMPGDDVAARWARLAGDATFLSGSGLYEHRPWAFQRLTPERFAEHVAAGEVLGADATAGWALLLISRATSLEDGELWPALLAGDGGAALALLRSLGAAVRPPRVRLPDPAPLLQGHEAAYAAAGYAPHEGQAVVVARSLDAAGPAPAPDPARLRMQRIVVSGNE